MSKRKILEKRIGLQGEHLLAAFLEGVELLVETKSSFFGTNEKRIAWLNPIKIHYESDYGTDFDVDFWESTMANKKRYSEPSGIHFFIQLKTTTIKKSPPKSFKLKDMYYFERQAIFRPVLLIWQNINCNSCNCNDRKVIDFIKWINNNDNKLRLFTSRSKNETESFNLGDNAWEDLNKTWFGEYISVLLKKVREQPLEVIFSVLNENLTFIEGIIHDFNITNVNPNTFPLKEYNLPIRIIEKNQKKLALLGVPVADTNSIVLTPDPTRKVGSFGTHLPGIMEAILIESDFDGILIVCCADINEHLMDNYNQIINSIDKMIFITSTEKLRQDSSNIKNFAMKVLNNL